MARSNRPSSSNFVYPVREVSPRRTFATSNLGKSSSVFGLRMFIRGSCVDASYLGRSYTYIAWELFLFAPQPPPQRGAQRDGPQARSLRVRHSQKCSRIDADEFNQKPRRPR